MNILRLPPDPVQPTPLWGPYSKTYPGAAAQVDLDLGLRWDCTIFPAIYRGPVQVPCHRWDSGFNPAWATPDLSAWAYEFELPLWRGQLSIEIAYLRQDASTTLFHARFKNGSDATRILSLHLCGSLVFPWAARRPIAAGPVRPPTGPGNIWVPALAYTACERAEPGDRDGLPPDAIIPGETEVAGAVNGHAFRWQPGNPTTLELMAPENAPDGRFLRLRAAEDGEGFLTVETGDGGSYRLEVGGVGRWHWYEVRSGGRSLRLTWHGNGPLDCDGLLLTNQRVRPEIEAPLWSPAPVEIVKAGPEARLFRYAGVHPWLGMAWNGPPGRWREFQGRSLESMLNESLHNHVRDVFHGGGEGYFANAYLSYIPVPAGETCVTGVLSSGEKRDLLQTVAQRPCNQAISAAVDAARARCQKRYSGRHAPGQTRLAATLLTNIVFPVRRFGEWFAHRSPGKWWDSLYTWDSGFIGLGLLEVDPKLAVETLDHYLCPPANPHAAFVHHGSLVPTQALLALEIWNRTRDRAWLRRVLPALRRYYHFLAGHHPHSRTARMASNLLQPWHYFYNSGGWDDYPAQAALHRDTSGPLLDQTAPVSTTAWVIRFAKILRALEVANAEPNSTPTASGGAPSADPFKVDYAADITRFASALQNHAWDETSGVFSYVLHDERGKPTAIFRHESGENFNRGLDGALPLAAGICDPAQRGRLLRFLFDPAHLWTPCGLSAVDQSASYYRPDGYWNGAVWFPYQWIFWKTLLDLGEDERGALLATTLLDLWSESVNTTGRCYEHFLVANRQGAGWHHFGGLSAPAANFYAALHEPGRLTGGLDLLLLADKIEPSTATRNVTFQRTAANTPATLLYVPPNNRPEEIHLNGKPVASRFYGGDAFAITLPAATETGRLTFLPTIRLNPNPLNL